MISKAIKIFFSISGLVISIILGTAAYEYYSYNYKKSFTFYICKNDVENVERLLKKGMDLNKRIDEVTSYPIITAVFEGCPDNFNGYVNYSHFKTEMIELLLKYGANVNVVDKNNNTALQHAIVNGLYRHASILIDAGANHL